jgi:DNA-binding XRE family transcriptional regulator
MDVLPTNNGALPVDNGDEEPARAKIRLRPGVLDGLRGSQAAQARGFGIDPGYYCRIRHGKRTPTLDAAMRIAAGVGRPIEALFERAA